MNTTKGEVTRYYTLRGGSPTAPVGLLTSIFTHPLILTLPSV